VVNAKLKKEAGGIAACSAAFIKEMNRFAKDIGMERTLYACVHGLPNRNNVSSAKDIAILSCVAMQHSLFAKIVNT
jgi:D-alanyl-D-alanine carboxypeptidase